MSLLNIAYIFCYSLTVRMALKSLSNLHMAKCLFWFCMLFVSIIVLL